MKFKQIEVKVPYSMQDGPLEDGWYQAKVTHVHSVSGELYLSIEVDTETEVPLMERK